MIYVDPPFELGQTLQGKSEAGVLINDQWLGTVFEFPAQRLSGSQIGAAKSRKVGRQIKAVILRNTSGLTLLGKRLGKLSVTAGYGYLKECIGYAVDLAEVNTVIIDDQLPATGVVDDDIFWGILEGPVTLRTCASGMITTAVGDKLGSGTGTTSQVTTSGGVTKIASPAIDKIVAVALSAKTTDNTMVEILAHACIKYF